MSLHNLKVVIKPFDPAKAAKALDDSMSTVISHETSAIQAIATLRKYRILLSYYFAHLIKF